MHYPDSRWRPRCQGKSRDDVSGRILFFLFFFKMFNGKDSDILVVIVGQYCSA